MWSARSNNWLADWARQAALWFNCRRAAINRARATSTVRAGDILFGNVTTAPSEADPAAALSEESYIGDGLSCDAVRMHGSACIDPAASHASRTSPLSAVAIGMGCLRIR